FQPKHLQPFRILLHTMSDNGKYSFSQNVYNVFAGLGTMNASILEKMSAGRWFAFQEIVMGSGNMCQRCLQSNLQLPGGIELNGSMLFRDRMYKQHDLSPPTIRKNHSFERQHLRRPLKAYVIHNKRFTDDDKIEIQAAIDEINKYTAVNKNQTTENGENLRWPLVHVSYISYPLIAAREEAKSQFSTPIIQSKTIISTPYIKGLYYPINERPLGIKRKIVIQLIRKATQLILNGFTIPVHPRENLASDGQLFTEMCELDQQFCMAVTERSEKNSFWCIDTWPEEIINENGPWSSKGIIDGGRTVMYPCNRTLLNQLRRKYSIDYHVKTMSNKTL
ncbi:unnamed protein product, partial [Rotaria magnacalcarata]